MATATLDRLAALVLTEGARRIRDEATAYLADAGPHAFGERYPDLADPFDDEGPSPIQLLTALGQHPYPRTIGWCDWAGEDEPGQVRSFIEVACRNLGLRAPRWDDRTEERVVESLGQDVLRGDYPPALLKDVDAQLAAVGLRLLVIDTGSDTYLFAPVSTSQLSRLDGVEGEGFALRGAST